jgi:hypothetical protein
MLLLPLALMVRDRVIPWRRRLVVTAALLHRTPPGLTMTPPGRIVQTKAVRVPQNDPEHGRRARAAREDAP